METLVLMLSPDVALNVVIYIYGVPLDTITIQTIMYVGRICVYIGFFALISTDKYYIL